MSTSEIAKLESRWRENRQGLTFAPLAEAYRKMGDPARALEVLGEGLAVNPNYIPASIVLGRCHLDLGDDRNAETAFVHVLELDSENVIALRALADIAERQGRLADAHGRLQSLLAVDRGNEEARAQLAILENRLAAGAAEPQPDDGLSQPEVAGGEIAGPVVPDPAGLAEEWDDAPVTAIAEHDTAVSWDDEPSAQPDAVADGNAVEADGVAGTSADGEADDMDWIPEPEPFTAGEVHADPSIQLQEHLTPDEAVTPLEDLVIDDAPPISNAAAESETMAGLVGQDFEEHSAAVVPLEDLKTGAGTLNDFDDLERVSELDLTPADSNEFQVASAAEELGARVQPEDDADSWLAREAPAELPQESAPAEFATVAGTFGSDALDEEAAGTDSLGAFAPDDRDPAGAESEAQIVGGEQQLDKEPEMDPAPASGLSDEGDGDLEWDDEDAADVGAPELVVTESMAELYLRQGPRKEGLAVYRLLYQRAPDDLRLRELVDALETQLAADAPGAAEPASVISLAAPDERHSVVALFRRMLGTPPAEAHRNWQEAVAPPARPLDQADEQRDIADGAPTRPAGDHLSLSDVFGDEGSPVPPAVRASNGGADDDVSFDAFFGDAPGEQVRSRAPARDDDDLDQFQSWLQNLKR
jgi:tetratricopeptide (TPR) repeat protein